GPERLPQLARKLGSWSTELRRAASDLRAGLEAEVGDLKAIRQDIQAPLDEVRGTMREVEKDAKRIEWVGPDPTSGPTAADALADLDEIEGRQTESPDPDPAGDEVEDTGE